jgi:hypothetical protein
MAEEIVHLTPGDVFVIHEDIIEDDPESEPGHRSRRVMQGHDGGLAARRGRWRRGRFLAKPAIREAAGGIIVTEWLDQRDDRQCGRECER